MIVIINYWYRSKVNGCVLENYENFIIFLTKHTIYPGRLWYTIFILYSRKGVYVDESSGRFSPGVIIRCK